MSAIEATIRPSAALTSLLWHDRQIAAWSSQKIDAVRAVRVVACTQRLPSSTASCDTFVL